MDKDEYEEDGHGGLHSGRATVRRQGRGNPQEISIRGDIRQDRQQFKGEPVTEGTAEVRTYQHKHDIPLIQTYMRDIALLPRCAYNHHSEDSWPHASYHDLDLSGGDDRDDGQGFEGSAEIVISRPNSSSTH